MYAYFYFPGSQMIATTLSTQENRASALGKLIIIVKPVDRIKMHMSRLHHCTDSIV